MGDKNKIGGFSFDSWAIDKDQPIMVTFDFGKVEEKVMANMVASPSIKYWTDSFGQKFPIPEDFWGFPKNRPYSNLYHINPDNVAQVRAVSWAMAYLISKNKYIQAVKYLRTELGWGLYEAKMFADDVKSGAIFVNPPIKTDKVETAIKETEAQISKLFGNVQGSIPASTSAEFEYSFERTRYLRNIVIAEMQHGGAGNGWLESARDLLDFARRKGYTKLQPKQAAKIWEEVKAYLGIKE